MLKIHLFNAAQMCAWMPAKATTYVYAGQTTPVTPYSSLNANWVIYGITDRTPGAAANSITPKAPDTCMKRADGTAFVMGDDVPMSCCMNGALS